MLSITVGHVGPGTEHIPTSSKVVACFADSLLAMPGKHDVLNQVLLVIAQVLKDLFSEEMQTAWHWLWEWLTESMFVVEAVRPEIELFESALMH